VQMSGQTTTLRKALQRPELNGGIAYISSISPG
jgi:hypothetical protein